MTRVARPNHTTSPSNGGRLICYNQPCKRKVLWKVGDEYYCNCCFDKWTQTNWDKFEPETIERLSDNERDFEFVARASPSAEPLCQVPRPIPLAEAEKEQSHEGVLRRERERELERESVRA